MSKQSNFAADYVDVATRLVEFREKHPDGSLQPADPGQPYKVERIGEDTYIVVVAAAYRQPGDTRPGIGMAYEVYPGRTPYTRGSELQNAETSAWGRAIMAALAADSRKGIASADEVRNRRAEQEPARDEQAVQDWTADITMRIATCEDPEELRGPIWTEIRERDRDGFITPAEAEQVATVVKQRVAQIAKRAEAEAVA